MLKVWEKGGKELFILLMQHILYMVHLLPACGV